MGMVGNLKRLLVASLATVALLTLVTVSGAAAPTSSVSSFQQCANGAPPSSATDCPEGWINSILQQNNSHYAEDDVTPQRVVVDLAKGSPLTDRSITISYQTRKNGVHAYDSLATWNRTQTTADRCAASPPRTASEGRHRHSRSRVIRRSSPTTTAPAARPRAIS